MEKLKPVFVGLAVLLILILLGITYYLVSTEDYREAVSATERAYERLDEFETELFTKKIIGNNIYYEINGNDYFIVMTDYTTMVYAQRQLTGKQATKYESYLQTKYGKTWDEVVADFAEYGFDELKKHDDGLDELVDEIRKEKENNGGN
ncbi:MAG: hypothetical protein K6A23_05260 [Butyrivibrio sp.]|nr:hypothetical protein [Butyrivibrio sp.]